MDKKGKKNKREQEEQNEKKTRFVVYARVSTALEEQKSSLKLQVNDLKEAILNNYAGFEYIDHYEDIGITGTKGREVRTGFNQMLNDVQEFKNDPKNRKFDVIVTKNLSRIARNTRVLLDTLDILRDCGIRLIIQEENIDTADAHNDFYLTVLGALAQMEATNTRAHIQESYAIRRGMGKPARPSAICLGYKIQKEENSKETQIVIDEEGAALVKRIFKMFVEEKKSTGAIATQLSIEGVEPPRKPGKSRNSARSGWYRSAIKYILQNKKYIGLVIEHDKSDPKNIKEIPFPGAYPAIIDNSTFNKAQKMLENMSKTDERAEQRRRVVNFKPKIYALSGLCFCGKCQERCTRYSTHAEYHRGYDFEDKCKGNPVWGCMNGRFGSKHPDFCDNYKISETYIYSMVIEALTHILTTSRCLQDYLADVSHMQAETIDYEKALAVYKADMKSFKEERIRILNMYQSQIIDENELHSRIAQLEKKVTKREETVPTPPDYDRSLLLEDLRVIAKMDWSEQSADQVRSWLQHILHKDDELKRSIVLALVESIEIGGEPRFRATIKIRGYDKKLVFWVPRRSPYRRKKRTALTTADKKPIYEMDIHYDIPELVEVID